MRYEPVRVLQLFEVVTNYLTGKSWRRKPYFQVRSRQFGSCGHNHRTKAAAQPCLKKMQKRWSDWRSFLSRQSAMKRVAGYSPRPKTLRQIRDTGSR